jgi:hypothetical protein
MLDAASTVCARSADDCHASRALERVAMRLRVARRPTSTSACGFETYGFDTIVCASSSAVARRLAPEKLICAACGESIELYEPATAGNAGSVTHYCTATGSHEVRAPATQVERELVAHASKCFRRQNPV